MPGLTDKRLVFVTGKGGVGRTTVATALGLAAAAAGKRVIVCEVAQQERMSRAFRSAGVGYAEVELRPRLFAISIDPQRALREYLSQQVGSERLSGLLFHNRIFEYFAAAAPGVRELATIGKVWELAQLERRASGSPYDLVIVDAPASGQGLAMLKTPHTYGEIARVGPIRRRADLIQGFIADRRQTGFVSVALAQEMPVTETLEFRTKLSDEVGVEVELVIVNALLPERFSSEEVRLLERAAAVDGGVAAPALRAALSEHHRARGERSQLRRLRKEVGAVTTLPFVWEPEIGLGELEALASELGRKLAI